MEDNPKITIEINQDVFINGIGYRLTAISNNGRGDVNARLRSHTSQAEIKSLNILIIPMPKTEDK